MPTTPDTRPFRGQRRGPQLKSGELVGVVFPPAHTASYSWRLRSSLPGNPLDAPVQAAPGNRAEYRHVQDAHRRLCPQAPTLTIVRANTTTTSFQHHGNILAAMG